MKDVVFAVPGDLATPTGGYVYDRRIIAGLPANGWHVDVLDLGEGFPRPSAPTRSAARSALAALPQNAVVVIDGLAFGVLAEEASVLCDRLRLVALVHHPLALEAGLSPREADALRESERTALACARAAITTSEAIARIVACDYGVPVERISAVRPGTDRVDVFSPGDDRTVTILSVGAVVPRKGYDILIAALAELIDLRWRLIIVGDRSRSAETAAALHVSVARLGLADRIRFAGAVSSEELDTLYASADLFVLPSRFEGYGMAFTEAIAHGVPVIGTIAGAIADTVPAGAGVLVRPDDVDALMAALRRLIGDPASRQELTAGARAAAASFPTWDESAQLFARALDRVS